MTPGRQIDPIARFMQEHDKTLLQLATLNRATRMLAEHGWVEDTFLRVMGSVHFLEEEIGTHNGLEEEALFPVLEKYVEGPTAMMRAEHRELRKELKKLLSSSKIVARGGHSRQNLNQLQQRAQVIIQALVNHIHKENNILFPLVQKFLTRDALREVAKRMV
jgi:regulator of cell morphogenesis and NO signaling